MGQVKEVFKDQFALKYQNNFEHSSSKIAQKLTPEEHKNNYDLFFNRLIQVSCIATTVLCTNIFNITYLAKKLVYLHDHKNLILDSSQYLFFDKLKETVTKILELQDYPSVCRRQFYFIAIDLIIYCQTIDRYNENDIIELADFIVLIRCNNFVDRIYSSKQKRLFYQLKREYNYYLKKELEKDE